MDKLLQNKGKVLYFKKESYKEADVEAKMILGEAGIYAVDENGFIGLKVNDYFSHNGSPYPGNYAIVVKGANFSDRGLGKVTLLEYGSEEIAGKTYRTVTIGNQTWLAQNLDLETSGSIVSNRRSENEDYGRLYQWAAAKALTIAGWHLPTRAEWNTLMNFVGTNIAGTKLKATFGWDSGNGTDDYGFGVLPAGSYYGNSYVNVGSNAYFWTSEESSSSNAYVKYFGTGSSMGESYYSKTSYSSVRLVKNSQ